MYSKKYIPLHCQNETRISIKNKTNMKAVEKNKNLKYTLNGVITIMKYAPN